MRLAQKTSEEILSLHKKYQKALSSYPDKTVHEDGNVTINQVDDSYYLDNDVWNWTHTSEINQFKEIIAGTKHKGKVYFEFVNPFLNTEMKYIFHYQLFNENWRPSTFFRAHNSNLRKITSFINQKYTTLTSLLELEIDKAEREYVFWLIENGIQTEKFMKRITHKSYTTKSSTAAF